MVKVRVTVLPARKRWVFLKAFDPDDPSASNDEVDDDSVTKGRDNRWILKEGLWYWGGLNFMAGGVIIQRTTGADGVFEIQYQVSRRPGDNFRIAATLDRRHFARLTNDNVPACDDQVNEFQGSLSPMLTIWRQLHYEFDIMDTPTFAQNASTGTWSISESGPAITWISCSIANDPADGGNYWMMGGAALTAGGATANVIILESDTSGRIKVNTDDLAPLGTATSGTIVIGDDDFNVDEATSPPAAFVAGTRGCAFPMATPDASARSYLDRVWSHAYVQTVWHDDLTGSYPFVRNVANAHGGLGGGMTAISDYSTLQSLTRADAFWAAGVAILFQPNAASDVDPSSEAAICGLSINTILDDDSALVFWEATRDGMPTANGVRFGTIIAHETGHLWGLAHSSDPATLMYAQPASGSLFAPIELDIIRGTTD
jgi:hypothetical protein